MAIQQPVTIGPAPRVSRSGRRPQHTFQVRHMPWQIVPFMIAPVLPGDTLKNLLLQSRAVSSPVKNPLVGWWLEYYIFYVPHRALVYWEMDQALQNMMLDPTYDATALKRGSASADWYTFAGGMDFVVAALEQVVLEFFRDEDEQADPSPYIGNYPLAQLNNTTWMQSVMTQTEYEANLPIDVDVEGPDANTTVQYSEILAAQKQWLLLAQAGLTDQTYEDYLRTYGVKIPDRETVIKPELIRYVREWTYPSNTVDPASGTPTSALSWSIAERADKDRFFKEPGFILGATVARPKVYLSKQTGAGVGMLDDVLAWLPAVLGDDPTVSMKHFAEAAGPLPEVTVGTAGYWADVKDLFMYGDQFTNIPLSDTAASMVAVPDANLVKKYAAAADVNGLFVGATDATRVVKQDGVVSLNILSRVVDTSAKT